MGFRATTRGVLGVVCVLGLGLRVGTLWASSGGPSGNVGYDASVYFAAADALVHGRLPYRDFVLLHPPGVMLALAPFAALARFVGDHPAFMIADAAFSALGAATGVALYGVARRLGINAMASLAGAAFYEVWFGAVAPETSVRLEPLGNLLFACGWFLLAAQGAEGRGAGTSRRAVLVGGALLGVAVSVKIWWIVPVLVVLGWLFATTSRRRALVALGGVGIGATIVNAPFFIAAPSAMWQSVVLDQIGRGVSDTSRVTRAEQFSSVASAFPRLSPGAQLALVVSAGVGLLVLAVRAWQGRTARVAVAVAVSQLVVLAAAPSYFAHYADFGACGLALLLAGGAQRTGSTGRIRWSAAAVLTVAAGLTVVASFVRANLSATPFPSVPMTDGAIGVRCLMADDPMALIELDALSSDFAHHCPNWVDVTGRTYGADKAAPGVGRAQNSRWQRDLRRYLTSGRAYVTIRPGTGYSAATRRWLTRHPVLTDADGLVIRQAVRTGAVRGAADQPRRSAPPISPADQPRRSAPPISPADQLRRMIK